MKTKLTFLFAVCLLHIAILKAQTNTFPQSGNVGIGTLTPATDLQVIGTTRMGSTNNYAQVDGSGNLSFKGSGLYKVGNNKYVFQSSASSGYGLFFNTADDFYEFRDANARPVFYVNRNTGQGYFIGGVKIGNSALTTPGNLRWTGSDFEGYTGTSWTSLTQKGWLLTGNAGTNPAVNFIGTTDNQPLVIKVNNTFSGYLSPDSFNTVFGYESQLDNTDYATTAFGYSVLRNNTGLFNTAVGTYCMHENTIGAQNTAMGANTLRENTTGSDNTAFGHIALGANTTGSENTAIGNAALSGNTTGFGNSALGGVVLSHNSTGTLNTAIGTSALSENTIGNSNTATGGSALAFNTIGEDNTANGAYAAFLNTTGINNVAVGRNALYDNSTGQGNTAVGYSAGRTNQTGSNNTSIGRNAKQNANNYSNNIVLGFNAVGTASNQVRIGNSAVNSIGGYVNWSNISDGRYKKNIKENVPGLDFINALKPVTYNLDIKGINSFLVKNANGNTIEKIQDDEAIAAKEQEIQTGFVAQDVEKAAKKLGFNFSGVDAPKNDRDLYGLRYAEFVVPLVKAVQELSIENDELKNTNESLQNEVNDLKNKMDMILQKMGVNESNQISSVQSSNSKTTMLQNDAARLEQNKPNPAGNNTIINYYLPQSSTNAQLIINDAAGRTVKNIVLTNKGAGQVSFNTSALIQGNYFYTLIVDGKKIDTKQMILTK